MRWWMPKWFRAMVFAVAFCGSSAIAADERPNIFLIISDDQAWMHTSANGCTAIATPGFDRLAKEGVLFPNGFSHVPQCAPARGVLLTGRHMWQLENGAVQRSYLPAKFVCYPDLLREAGYDVGFAGKGWGPGGLKGDRKANPSGRPYKSFAEFLAKRDAEKPFCFWYGSASPHRPHNAGRGHKVDMAAIKVPPFLPDVPIVREDLASYLREIVEFDHEVVGLLKALDEAGLADNTLVVITSDNGMPFPRGKCNLYDHGVRVPLAMRWPAKVPGGRVVEDFVSFPDLGPTFLEAAGVPIPPYMTGRSVARVLTSGKSGRVDPARDHVILARERHSVTRPGHLTYPVRGIRTHDYLYLRNFEPDRSPSGEPIGTADTDPSQAIEYMLAHRDDPNVEAMVKLCLLKRPGEELYDLKKDPEQIRNVADDPAYASIKAELAQRMMTFLTSTDDPRALGRGEVFDKYPFVLKPNEKKIMQLHDKDGK